jgi:hypothetical protein
MMHRNDRFRMVMISTIVMAMVALAATQLPKVSAAASWALSRAGSIVKIDDVGQINLTPTSGKGVAIGGGAAVKKVLSGTASVDFTALAAGTCENFTVTVTGAANGDAVAVGIPAAAWATTEYATIQSFVSAADTVTVKRCNLTNATTALSNPAAVTIRATVFQF